MPLAKALQFLALPLQNNSSQHLRSWAWIYLLFALCFAQYCSDPATTSKTAKNTSAQTLDGQALAKAYCANCHLFPEPALLDRPTWKNYLLPRMGALLGIYKDGYGYYNQVPDHWLEPGPGGERILAAKIYPEEPLLSRAEWEAIENYYLAEAPSQLSSASAELEIEVGIPFMEARTFAQGNIIPPLIQGVGVDQEQQQVYVSVFEEGIWQFDYQGKLLDKAPGKMLVPSFSAGKDHFAMVDMGTRLASDFPQGTLTIANSWADYQSGQATTSITGMMRPVHVARGDLNGDQRADYVVSEYGNLLGQLSWWEATDGPDFKGHQLFLDDGSVASEILDYDGDGDQDILVLQANADEGLHLYQNQGDGQFKPQRLLRFLPTNGSTHFESVDFDGDQQLDLLVCNGDNGDYPPVLKPHHGIRLYRQEKGTFKEAFFLPLNGVYQATAQDFDLDGDLDIAAVSFHPDFRKHPQESFVIYLQEAPNQFKAYTIPQYGYSRWMRFQCFDWDQDGDQDLLLSAFNAKTPDIPERLAQDWQITGEALMLLENKTR